MQRTESARKVGVGYRVGKLTVCEATKERKSRYTVWRCACDCGGEILLDTRCLQRGTVTDCGCEAKVRAGQRDLTGERFGKLICLEPTDRRDSEGGVMWRCRCDCGNECLAASTQLARGHKKSCGCLSKPQLKKYIGKRFDALLVTGYAGRKDGKHQWRCRCDCGREAVVSQPNLQSGHTTSCGCRQRSTYRENLKLVDGTSVAMIENRMLRPIKSNRSGYNGVYFSQQRNAWGAQITFKGKTYFLGNYQNLEDAVRARKRGEEMYDRFLEWYYKEFRK